MLAQTTQTRIAVAQPPFVESRVESRGDSGARLYELLRRRALMLTGNRADADDLVQDTYERALRSPLPDERGENATRAWYMRIMYNRFIDEKRRARALPLVPLSELEGNYPPANDVGEPHRLWRTVSDEEIQACLSRLPQLARAVLLMREQGIDAHVIAAELGISYRTVYTRVFRARGQLRALLLARRRQLERANSQT